MVENPERDPPHTSNRFLTRKEIFKRGYTGGKKAHEKNVGIINHRKMPVKTTMRYYDTPIRTIKIKDNDSIKC